ncbi:MAG: hypothetical protein ABIT71_16895 [Vicinamibacteraceae bacterium]
MAVVPHADSRAGARAPKRGRPRKFGRPARSVALTLPLDVIATLERHDSDLARAIVQLVAKSGPDRAAAREAELSRYGRRAVILVNPSRTLRRIPGVELVPLPSGRALISLDRSMTPEAFELRLRDALDAGVPDSDRDAVRQIVQVLTDARRSRGVQLQARTILVLESIRPRR